MIDKDGNLIVTKANAFVQGYKMPLSLAEIRIINYLIANIRSPKYDTEFRKFRFEIKEFCDIVYPDKKRGDAYAWLPDVIKKLSDKSAWKEVPSTENPGKMKKVLIRWIERPTFEEGYVTMELNPELAPYLLQLDNNYFRAQFKYTAESQSKYTIPLYELLKSWEKVKDGVKSFEVDELRAHMNAMQKSKDNYAEFKRSALDLAVKEINEITDLVVSYEEIRRGRGGKVVQVQFTISHKNNEKKTKAKPSNSSTSNASGHEYKDPYNKFLAEACYFEFSETQIESLRSLLEMKKLVPASFSEDLTHWKQRKYDFLRYMYSLFLVEVEAAAAKKDPIVKKYEYFRTMVENAKPLPAPEERTSSYDLDEYEQYDLFAAMEGKK